jgi:2,3-bisphosphoglycerate-independent phosphoglycerate mutase
MKYILVIGDGMADDPIPELGGKTPLQYASIQAMDELASAGVLGNAITVPEGMQAGSDTAILSIFGCDPRSFFVGRAPLEAAAMDIRLSPGDVAYRCNMVAIEDGNIVFEEKKILSHSAGAIGGDESNTLLAELFETPVFKAAASKLGIKAYPGSSFRHIAVQFAPDNDGIKTTPPHDHLDEALGPLLPCGCENAANLEELIRLSHEILDNHPINIKRRADGKHPANCIWLWAQGEAVVLPNFTEKYGKSGGIITAVPLCHGIGTLLGLERIYVEGATGELHTNYEGKVDAVLEVLKTRDFATVHIEAPDECTHSGDLKGKLQAIEWVDSRIIAPLLRRLGESKMDFRMLMMTDHRTLLSTRGHDGGPVPYVIYDSRTDNKTGLGFNEADAAKTVAIIGSLTSGTDLINLLFGESKESNENNDGNLKGICQG